MKTFIIDSFTDRAFRGNPAGVCIADPDLSEETMLSIAQELNLSETAFIRPLAKNGAFSIRFFSPKMEIPLCGHATLAASRAVFATYGVGDPHFINAQNLDLAARVTKDRTSMTFPVYETHPAIAPAALLDALRIDEIVNARYNEELRILLLEISDPGELTALAPNFTALLRSHDSINGVLVTARAANDGYDFHSRYFWPWSGTNEDPVTGGTHTFLAKYWSEKLGKTKMRSFQSSPRSGSMDVELAGEELVITSQAIIVLEGDLSI